MKRLSEHKIIGLDMDETLVNGAKSRLLRNYVRNNRDKTYHIVTFRNEYDDVWDELDYFNLTNIAEVHYCPHEIWMGYINYQKTGNMYYYHRYTEWKGFKCKEIGATVLVDDLPHHVIAGCKKYDIKYINPLFLVKE